MYAFLRAKQYEKLLKHKKVKNKTELAQKEKTSKARITQILNLLKLAPEIQEYLKNLTDEKQLRFFTEKRLRPITQIKDHEAQLRKFTGLKSQVEDQEWGKT